MAPILLSLFADLRVELAEECAALRGAEGAYADERRLRAQAEDALEAVRQEQAAPFVVPALLDAFLKLVKLSDSALFAASETGKH